MARAPLVLARERDGVGDGNVPVAATDSPGHGKAHADCAVRARVGRASDAQAGEVPGAQFLAAEPCSRRVIRISRNIRFGQGR